MEKRILTSLFTVVFLLLIVAMVWAGSYKGPGKTSDKWYGDGKDLGFIGPQEGVCPETDYQKVLNSWGYLGDNSVDEIKDLVPPSFFKVLKNPEVWGKVRINLTEFIEPKGKAYKNFVAMTKEYEGTCKVDEYNGLHNYKGGTPFPEPKTGVEAMWNNINRFRGDTRYMPYIQLITDKQGRVRVTSGKNIMLYYNGRLVSEPKPIYTPNPDGLELVQVFGWDNPYELRGTFALLKRYFDPKKQDDMWMYLPSLRRVRRMSTAQRCDRLPGGSGTTWDFWEGFNGKMSQYKFKIVDKKEQLVSLQASSEAQVEKHLTGVDQYFQKRTCYIIEAKPKSANVVYSKFRFWMEDTCWLPFYGEAFDLRGNLWQMNNFNQCWDINWMPYALNMMCPIDLQRTHSTTSLMSDAILNKEFKPEFFSLNKLKKYYAGR